MNLAICYGLSMLLIGCASPPQQATIDPKDVLTLGKVQQTIKKGMSQDQIVKEIGSPNLVTQDRNGVETWIYDKVRADVPASSNNDKGFLGSGGVLGTGFLSGAPNASEGNVAQIKSSKTLTVIMKFRNKTLTDFAFNSTTF